MNFTHIFHTIHILHVYCISVSFFLLFLICFNLGILNLSSLRDEIWRLIFGITAVDWYILIPACLSTKTKYQQHAVALMLIYYLYFDTLTLLLELRFPCEIMGAWWCLHAAISNLSHYLSGIFCCGGFSCGHLKPVLDVTLLCFRDLLVPAMREVGKLWVFYSLTHWQMFPGCMALGAVTVNFRSNVVIEVKRLCKQPCLLSIWLSAMSVLSLIPIPPVGLFVVSCCLPCWPTGNGWATRDEGEEWQCQ